MKKDYYLDLWRNESKEDTENQYIWNYLIEPWDNVKERYEAGELEGEGELGEFLFKKRDKEEMLFDFNEGRSASIQSYNSFVRLHEDFRQFELYEIIRSRKSPIIRFLNLFFVRDFDTDKGCLLIPSLLGSLVETIDRIKKEDLESAHTELSDIGGNHLTLEEFLQLTECLFSFIKKSASGDQSLITVLTKV